MPTTVPVASAGLAATAPARTSAKTLGKDAFLQLLVTQLRNQDPLSPMQDADFVAQLAQFSSLEQMTNLSANFEKFGKTMGFAQAVNLIGRSVDYLTADGKTLTGKVQGVLWDNGAVALCIGDDAVDLQDVVKVYAVGSDF